MAVINLVHDWSTSTPELDKILDEERLKAVPRLYDMLDYPENLANPSPMPSGQPQPQPDQRQTRAMTRARLTVSNQVPDPDDSQPALRTVNSIPTKSMISGVPVSKMQSLRANRDKTVAQTAQGYCMVTDETHEGVTDPMVDFVARLGLSSEYQAAHKKAQRWLESPGTRLGNKLARLEEAMASESGTRLRTKIDEKHFLQYMADTATTNKSPQRPCSSLEWKSGAGPHIAKSPYIEFGRTVDAHLQLRDAKTVSWSNILSLAEFTNEIIPNLYNMDTVGAGKIRQATVSCIDILNIVQDTRLFMPGIACFRGKHDKVKKDEEVNVKAKVKKGSKGKGKQRKKSGNVDSDTTALGPLAESTATSERTWDMVAFIVDRESLVIYHMKDFLSPKKYPAAAAVLSVMQTASVYSLGFNPHFTYRYLPEVQLKAKEKKAEGFYPRFLHLPSDFVSHPTLRQQFKLNIPDKRYELVRKLHVIPPTLFGRSTWVYQAVAFEEEGAQPVIIKVHYASITRSYRESRAFEELNRTHWSCNPKVKSLPSIDPIVNGFFPEYVTSFASKRMSWQVDEAAIAQAKVLYSSNSSNRLFKPVLRHLEVLVTCNPNGQVPRSIMEVESKHDLFVAVATATRHLQKIYETCHSLVHGDISTGNFLIFSSGLPYLIDWECATSQSLHWPGESPQLTGTMDTMAIALLDGKALQHHFHHELESLAYIVAKVISRRLQTELFKFNWAKPWMFHPTTDIEAVFLARKSLWRNAETFSEVKQVAIAAFWNGMHSVELSQLRSGTCDHPNTEDDMACVSPFLALLDTAASDTASEGWKVQ